jgi:hypothetical protein
MLVYACSQDAQERSHPPLNPIIRRTGCEQPGISCMALLCCYDSPPPPPPTHHLHPSHRPDTKGRRLCRTGAKRERVAFHSNSTTCLLAMQLPGRANHHCLSVTVCSAVCPLPKLCVTVPKLVLCVMRPTAMPSGHTTSNTTSPHSLATKLPLVLCRQANEMLRLAAMMV